MLHFFMHHLSYPSTRSSCDGLGTSAIGRNFEAALSTSRKEQGIVTLQAQRKDLIYLYTWIPVLYYSSTAYIIWSHTGYNAR